MDVTIHDIKFQTKWATDENILERGGTKKVMEIQVQVILNLNELLNWFCGT